MDLGLKGKIALITGASKGIGLACAEMMAAEGCKLHLAARSESDLLAVKKDIESRFPMAVDIHVVDLSRGDEARRLAAECADIDILINNAGAIPRGDLWQIEEARWREVWDLKLFGYINLCRAAYPQMKSRGKGVIINVIGAAGERPRQDYIAGGTANAALMAFTKGLGAKSLKDGIRVVGINPGLIQTQRLETLLQGYAQAKFNDSSRWKELLPNDPKPGMPQDIANLVAFLSSNRAQYITGTVITADGGISGY